MGTRSISFGLLACVAAAICGGCKKSEPPAPPSAAPAADLVARVHWLGKKRLAAEPNAAYFMTLWNLPESAALEAQTLDRLARALAHDTHQLATLSSTNPPIHQSTNPLASQSPNPPTPDPTTPSPPPPPSLPPTAPAHGPCLNHQLSTLNYQPPRATSNSRAPVTGLSWALASSPTPPSRISWPASSAGSRPFPRARPTSGSKPTSISAPSPALSPSAGTCPTAVPRSPCPPLATGNMYALG